MPPSGLVTISEAAERLGTDRFTIAGLIKAHGIATKPFPYNAAAKGLDARDLAILARALGLPRRRAERDGAPA